jgi:hypothetical protein
VPIGSLIDPGNQARSLGVAPFRAVLRALRRQDRKSGAGRRLGYGLSLSGWAVSDPIQPDSNG